MRILLIEDDTGLAEILSQALTTQHHVVDTVADGQIGWNCAQSVAYDLILLDIDLPKLDGITLCQRLRSEGITTPILLMTAKDATRDRIRGLDAGADDYLIKPLVLEELQARVRALLRRGEAPRTPILQVGALRLDPITCQVSYQEKPLHLTPKEYSLLELFLRNPTRVFSLGNIIEHLWSFDDPPQEESVKSHIKGLRQKLKTAGAVDWIENVYGLGYRLRAGVGEKDIRGKPQPTIELAAVSPKKAQRAVPTSGTKALAPDTLPEQQFNKGVDALWEQFQGLMAQRLETLKQAAAAVQAGTLSVALQQSAEREAHKLAGVLGMFNKDSGTQTAREIEQLLTAHQSFQPPQEKRLVELVRSLENLLNLSISEKSSPSVPDRSQPVSASSTNVLAVDDDPIVLAALHQMLEPWGMTVTKLDHPDHFWDVLTTVNPDLLILDVVMPNISGIELCQALRSDRRWQGLPVIFLTAHRDTATIEQVFLAGADDYVVKPVAEPELLARINNRLERTRLLQTLSTKDPITGLANQYQSNQDLEKLLESSDRANFCLTVFNITDLRHIHIQYGHSMGNQVLQRWGRLFQSTLPNSAIVGYWGNGEFLVGFHQPTLSTHEPSEVEHHLSQLATALRQEIFTAPDGSRFQALFNTGSAIYPTDGQTIPALYSCAIVCALKLGNCS